MKKKQVPKAVSEYFSNLGKISWENRRRKMIKDGLEKGEEENKEEENHEDKSNS